MPSILSQLSKLAQSGNVVVTPRTEEPDRPDFTRSETEIHGNRKVSGIVRDVSDLSARDADDRFSWDDPYTWTNPPQGVSSSNLSTVAYDVRHRLMQITFVSG